MRVAETVWQGDRGKSGAADRHGGGVQVRGSCLRAELGCSMRVLRTARSMQQIVMPRFRAVAARLTERPITWGVRITQYLIPQGGAVH